MQKVLENPATEVTSRIPSTQDEILKRVLDASEENLFWLRVNTAEWWLLEVERVRDKSVVRERYMKSNAFWEWWIKMFAWNDRLFLDWMNRAEITVIAWKKYVDHIKLRQSCNWRMTPLFPEVSNQPINNPRKEENPPIENPYKEGIGRSPITEENILKHVRQADVDRLFWLRVEQALKFCIHWRGKKEGAILMRQKFFWDNWMITWTHLDNWLLENNLDGIKDWAAYKWSVEKHFEVRRKEMVEAFNQFVLPEFKIALRKK